MCSGTLVAASSLFPGRYSNDGAAAACCVQECVGMSVYISRLEKET